MKLLSKTLLFLVIGFGIYAATAVWSLLSLVCVSDNAPFCVQRGSSFSSISAALGERANLPPSFLFVPFVRGLYYWTGTGVQAGCHVLPESLSVLDLFLGLSGGSYIRIERVTIPEGWQYREIASRLGAAGVCDSADFVVWCEDDSVCSEYCTTGSMEGFLMPDTYDFYRGQSAASVGGIMARHFGNTFERLRKKHAGADGPLLNDRDVVTLASIIQAEATARAEMNSIAGVYVNRLTKAIPLMADPTVQYGMGHKRRITVRDLQNDNPYNTYVHVGLPVGPICNPGEDALVAALKPEVHDYLYFVSDGNGRHVFSISLKDHNRAAAKYRRARGW